MTADLGSRPLRTTRAGSRRPAGPLPIALGLAACATPGPPPEIGYLAPTGLPPTRRSALVQQRPSLVLGNLVDRLQQSSFVVTQLDEQNGYVVVRYSGDPEPYVDCGWIVTYQTGGLQRIPAATATASFDREVEQNVLELDRDLRLDGRMVVSLEPEGPNTLVNTDTTYVLTKTVDAVRPGGGSPRSRARDDQLQDRRIRQLHQGHAVPAQWPPRAGRARQPACDLDRPAAAARSGGGQRGARARCSRPPDRDG